MPERVAIDTGPIVALFDRQDAWHSRAVEFLQTVRGQLVTNLAVVTEAMHLLDFDLTGQINLLTWLKRGAVTLVEPQLEDLDRAAELMQKYHDLPMDFADALLVAICERLGVRQVATMDEDFSLYRLHGRAKFHNVLRNRKS